uniref:Secreted protein n=1 Tax=Knipowitschia caucasica TaxID=637954 RepID=A0AAV2JIE5_KNICA
MWLLGPWFLCLGNSWFLKASDTNERRRPHSLRRTRLFCLNLKLRTRNMRPVCDRDRTGPGQTGPGQTGPGQTGPGQTGPGQAGPGQTGRDRTRHTQSDLPPSQTVERTGATGKLETAF